MRGEGLSVWRSVVVYMYIVHCGPPVRFHATLYQCPETANERAEMSVAVSNRIDDLTSVLRTTEDHSITQLQDIGQELDIWKTKVSGREGGREEGETELRFK